MATRKKKAQNSQSLTLFSDESQIEDEVAEPALPKGSKYEPDEADGLPREIVGSWVKDKHLRLARYVYISGVGVRKKWLKNGPAGATYIELFSGPGRVRIKGTAEVLDGSPLLAWKTAVEAQAPFSSVFVADANADLCSAPATRLATLNAPVKPHVGEALTVVDSVIAALNPYALHLAFLDPYGLEGLPFVLIQKLAKLEHMDILMHISVQDLNGNLRKYIDMQVSPLDQFAPKWRSLVDVSRDDKLVRGKIFEHWRGLLRTIGMQTAEAAELVSADGNQPLYWLAFVARHSRALAFWEKVRDLKGQGALHAA